MDIYLYIHLIFLTMIWKQSNGRKNSLNKWGWEIWILFKKAIYLDLYLTLNPNIKMYYRLEYKIKAINLLETNIGENLC